MTSTAQPLQIGNINELRSILNDISIQNSHSIRDLLKEYLEDQHLLVKKISTLCVQELQKKQHNLQNLINFSLLLLSQLQAKTESNDKNHCQITSLQIDFDRLISYNEDLIKKIDQMQEQKTQFKSKIQQAQTYFSQVSQSDNLKASIQSLRSVEIHKIQISTLGANTHSPFTERLLLQHQTYQQKEQQREKKGCFELLIQEKTNFILGLEEQIQSLKNTINHLQNQLSMKSSQLELSEIYFREKIGIIANNEAFNRSRKVSVSDLQINSVFKRQLSRTSSVRSIDSIVQSSASQSSNDDDQNFQRKMQNANEQIFQRKNKMRRSLMQEFVTDFTSEIKASMSSQIMYKEGQSPNNSCIFRQRKKSVSISTADIRKTSTKAVQTGTDSYSRYSRKTSNVKKQKKIEHQSSFLGLRSITSLFSKKGVNKNNEYGSHTIQNCILKDLEKDQVQEQGQSSLGDIFKGIFQYATKKIVTDRVHKKSRGHSSISLNQSISQVFRHSSRVDLKHCKKSQH